MKKYLARMQQKTPHERRQHAARIAGIVTAVVFVGWLGTLGYRLSGAGGTTTAEQQDQSSQLANVLSGTYVPQQDNSLEVATGTNPYAVPSSVGQQQAGANETALPQY